MVRGVFGAGARDELVKILHLCIEIFELSIDYTNRLGMDRFCGILYRVAVLIGSLRLSLVNESPK